jgi:cephalosporin-C deacetylase-like acetyl esterase
MVHEHYVNRLREISSERKQRIDALATQKDAEAYVLKIRKRVRKCFAPMPRKTPLKPVVTDRREFPGYVMENILYESRPEFLVSANLYLPKKLDSKAPAVLGLCGHYEIGKECDLYQAFSQSLARAGFVVLLIDPISQGERRQFYPSDGGKRPGLCHAHNLLGNAMTLVDDFFGTWRVWDAIRGLDYLESRPEVDKTRLGVTGNSGGGTLTTYVSALDPRITMAAPGCYIGSVLANLENELPADSEQNPPGLLAAGLDEADLLLCYAPRPTLILSQEHDFFDPRAARDACRDLKRVHRLLGSASSAKFYMGPQGHGYHIENREAMVRFFKKHAGLPGSWKESGIKLQDHSVLNATSRGDTCNAGSRRVVDFTKATALSMAQSRKRLSERQLVKVARRLLGISKSVNRPHARVLASQKHFDPEKNKCLDLAFETEAGIHAYTTVHSSRELGMTPVKKRVAVYVGHISGREDLEQLKWVQDLASKTTPLFIIDPRGMGQSRALTCGDTEFLSPYRADFLYASTGDMLSESLLGRRVFDGMQALTWLRENGAENILIIGRGLGALTALFAGLLHPAKPKVEMVNYLPSYQEIIENPLHIWPLSSFLRGVLKHFDLPDVHRCLGKRLKKRDPWDARMKTSKT